MSKKSKTNQPVESVSIVAAGPKPMPPDEASAKSAASGSVPTGSAAPEPVPTDALPIESLPIESFPMGVVHNDPAPTAETQPMPLSNPEPTTTEPIPPPPVVNQPQASGWGLADQAPTAPTVHAPPTSKPAAKSFKKGPRIGLIIWGLIIASMGAWIIAGSAGYRIDGQLAVIGLAAGTGLLLVITAIISAIRRPDR